MNQKHMTLRAYDEVKKVWAKDGSGKVHGFQVCGIVKGEGRVEEFEQYFNPDKASHFLAPGDYTAVAGGLYLDRKGNLQIEREFVPVAKVAKAA